MKFLPYISHYKSSTNRHSDVSGKKNKSLYVTMSICRQNVPDLNCVYLKLSVQHENSYTQDILYACQSI